MRLNLVMTEIATRLKVPGGGIVLGTRPIALRLKKEVHDTIIFSNGVKILTLDFTGVDVCDYSCVDEVIIENQQYLKEHTDIFMYITNANKDVLGNLHSTIAWREKQGMKTHILYQYEGEFLVAGTLEESLQQTFNIISAKKSITARELADFLDIQINNASNRLKKLYDSRLVLRTEQRDSMGKQHIYMLPE